MMARWRMFAGILVLAVSALIPPDAQALNPNHQCNYCHDLHGGFSFSPIGGVEPETLCLSCHGIGSPAPPAGSAIKVEPHKNRATSNYAPFYVTCLRCHNPHDGLNNWLDGHADDTNPPDDPFTWTEGRNVKLIGRPDPRFLPVTQSTLFRNRTGISAAAADNSYNSTSIDFTRVVSAGQSIVVRGFGIAANNGFAVVNSVTPGKVTVTPYRAMPPEICCPLETDPAPSLVDEPDGNPISFEPPATIASLELDPDADGVADIDPDGAGPISCEPGGPFPNATEDNCCYVPGTRHVVFEQRGADIEAGKTTHSFADEDEDTIAGPDTLPSDPFSPPHTGRWDGPCEACHTRTGHHRNWCEDDGGGRCETARNFGHDGHNDGKTCTECHAHADGFMPSAVRAEGFRQCTLP